MAFNTIKIIIQNQKPGICIQQQHHYAWHKIIIPISSYLFLLCKIFENDKMTNRNVCNISCSCLTTVS